MGRVRVFYGHEGVVPPTGLRSRSAAPAAPVMGDPEFDEIVADSLEGEPIEIVGEPVEEGEIVATAHVEMADGSEVEIDEGGVPILPVVDEDELPNGDWTVGEIDSWAKTHDVDLTGATKTKATRLTRISEALNKGE